MMRRGPAAPEDVATRLADAIAKSLIPQFRGVVQAADLQSFAAEGAVEALHEWDGRGQFEGFAAQRIRWAVLRHAKREILRRLPGEQQEEGCAVVAAERAVDTFDRSPDEVPGPLPSPVELAEVAAEAFRLELAHLEEVAHIPDPDADVERAVERMKLRRAILRLPPAESAVVERYVYLGETLVEIGAALKMRRSTVHEVYHRGIARLLDMLGAESVREPLPSHAPPPA